MNTKNPSLHRALCHLQSVIDTFQMTSSAVALPSVKKLAVDAGVSYVTMWKAMKSFEESSKVHRQGIRHYTGAVSTDSFTSVTIQPVRKWQRLKQTIEKDIISGTLSRGAILPTLGECIARYHVTYPTLKRALEAMVTDGSLEPFKKTYRIPRISKTSASVSIGLIVAIAADGSIRVYDRLQAVIQALETECSTARINLRILPVHTPPDPESFLNSLPSQSDTIGYVVLCGNYSKPERTAIASIATGIGKNIPIALFDELGNVTIPQTSKHKNLRLFTIASHTAGQKIGRLLIEQGHRSVGFFSGHHYHGWSISRLAGLKKQYLQSCSDGPVYPFVESSVHDLFEGLLALCGISEEDYFYIADVTGQKEALEFARRQGSWKYGSSLEAFKSRPELLPGAFDELKDTTESFLSILRTPTSRQFKHGIVDSYLKYLTDIGYKLLLAPLFEEALKNKAITAWVGVNDATAFTALQYLKTKGFRIPRDINLIGFDDSVDAFNQGLTSYNIHAPRIASTILSYIVNPSKFSSLYPNSYVEIEGELIQRRTTARAI